MHKYINITEKYLKTALWLFLCVFFAGNSHAFMVSGVGSNLRIVQSNQAKSVNFQVNAKLKPTAVGQVILASATTTTTTTTTTSAIPTPVVMTSGGSDSSSPYLGTANWSKQGRSQRATDRRKLAQAEDTLQHTSAPKTEEIINNLTTQIIAEPENSRDLPVVEEKEKTENPQIDAKTLEKTPVKKRFVAISDSKVVLNPAKFSLKFVADDIIEEENPAKNSCKVVQINNFYGNDYWYYIAKALFLIVICLTIGIFILAILVFRMWKAEQKKNKKSAKKSNWKKFFKLFPILFLIITATSQNVSAGPVTTPQQLIYEGDLLDNTGNPLTGNYSFRFSLWDNEDFESSDVIAGNINTGAADYFNWKEVQTQSLVNGKFSLKLGTVEPFFAGLFDRTNMYLQIEVKNAADPDTSYELIDLNIADATIDRTVIDTIPFAFNADKLDFRDSGYGPGEIPYIDPITGKLPASIIEAAAAGIVGGVDGNSFTLDLDGNAAAADNIVLKFGDILNKTLSWNGVNDQFEFNDDVNIAGNLVVTGTINGQSLAPKNKTEILSPRYPNSIIDKDGTDNSGSMYEETAVISAKNKNTIRWNTKQTVIQDYDIIIRYTLPANFAGFQASPISLELMSEGTFNDAKIDFVIEKEGSNADELQGSGIGFNSNAWTTVNLNLNPATTWNPNDVMILKLKMYSRNNLQSYVSDISLKYIEN